MARHHQVLFCLAAVFLLSAAANADDGAVMTALLYCLSSPPAGWSESTPYCQWTGVECDASKRVTTINLENRFLSGTLPVDLNKLTELQHLNIRANLFSGPFPILSGLASLEHAYLESNRFDSAPPGFLTGLTSLQGLSLSGNPNLPPWSFPSDFTESRSLYLLYAANANLTGSLPNIFGSVPNLHFLDLSRSSLTGDVPRSLYALKNIYSIDLSYNNLTGPIPVYPHARTYIFAGNSFGPPSASGFPLGQGILFGSVVASLFVPMLILFEGDN